MLFVRFEHVDQMMRHAAALLVRGLGGADVHRPIQGHRIQRYDLRIESGWCSAHCPASFGVVRRPGVRRSTREVLAYGEAATYGVMAVQVGHGLIEFGRLFRGFHW